MNTYSIIVTGLTLLMALFWLLACVSRRDAERTLEQAKALTAASEGERDEARRQAGKDEAEREAATEAVLTLTAEVGRLAGAAAGAEAEADRMRKVAHEAGTAASQLAVDLERWKADAVRRGEKVVALEKQFDEAQREARQWHNAHTAASATAARLAEANAVCERRAREALAARDASEARAAALAREKAETQEERDRLRQHLAEVSRVVTGGTGDGPEAGPWRPDGVAPAATGLPDGRA